jgi:hypothetical protein
VPVEYLNSDDELEVLKVDQDILEQSLRKLGTHTSSEVSYKKLYLRKHNSSLKRLEQFGLEFLVGIPKWASYSDAIAIIERYIVNIKNKNTRYSSED